MRVLRVHAVWYPEDCSPLKAAQMNIMLRLNGHDGNLQWCNTHEEDMFWKKNTEYNISHLSAWRVSTVFYFISYFYITFCVQYSRLKAGSLHLSGNTVTKWTQMIKTNSNYFYSLRQNGCRIIFHTVSFSRAKLNRLRCMWNSSACHLSGFTATVTGVCEHKGKGISRKLMGKECWREKHV